MPWRARPRDASHGPPLRPSQVLQVLADRLFVAEVMIGFDQTIEQRFICRSPCLLEFHRTEVAQRRLQRRGFEPNRFWSWTQVPALAADETPYRRQFDRAVTLESTANGKRFLVLAGREGDAGQAPLTVVVNWRQGR